MNINKDLNKMQYPFPIKNMKKTYVNQEEFSLIVINHLI